MEIIVNRFIDLLEEENKKQNLISRKAGRAEILQHVEDSCRILDFLSLSGRNVIDVGSGAGFPGLILAMLCPDARVTLVESDLKKSLFLIHSSQELGLDNVSVIRERAETLGRMKAYREHFDVCTSRAVASMNILLEYCLPLVKSSGLVAMWKGRNFEVEISAAEKCLEIMQGKIKDIFKYNLMADSDRVIVTVSRAGAIPAKYPRRAGIPAKRPL